MTRKDGGNGLEGQFLSSLFLVTRKGVGNGLVANLKKRNKSVTYQHLKMKGLFLSKEMLKPRDKICKIGLKDAFSKDESFFVTALQVVGNKVKRRISNRVFQENKARQIFRKSNISYPLIPIRTSEIRHFALVPTYYNNEHALLKMIETCIA